MTPHPPPWWFRTWGIHSGSPFQQMRNKWDVSYVDNQQPLETHMVGPTYVNRTRLLIGHYIQRLVIKHRRSIRLWGEEGALGTMRSWPNCSVLGLECRMGHLWVRTSMLSLSFLNWWMGLRRLGMISCLFSEPFCLSFSLSLNPSKG